MLAPERAESAIGILRERLAREGWAAEDLQGAPKLFGGRDAGVDLREGGELLLQLDTGHRAQERQQVPDVGVLRPVVRCRACTIETDETRGALRRENDALFSHIAVRGACGMQRAESAGEPAPDVEHAVVGERRRDRVESLPLHESRDDVRPRPPFADVVHAAEVRVGGARERARYRETLAVRIRRLGEEREDDGAIQGGVVRKEGRTVVPELADDAVIVD